MPITIGAGPSVNDYDNADLVDLCRYGFVFGVNHTFLHFPCDIIVSLDPQFIVDNVDLLKRCGKPVITREYPAVANRGLDLIYVPMDTIKKYPYSGMVAVKIADKIAALSEGRPSYVLGIDGGNGRYKGHPGTGPAKYTEGDYESLGLSKTVSLAIHSRISCWPKLSKLPNPRKVVVTPEYRTMVTAWIRANASKVIGGEI